MSKRKWKSMAKKLWLLLDDIDTAFDTWKSRDNEFHKFIINRVEERFKFMEGDGWKLFSIK